ncbi:MAG: DUF4923 family protein [Paramuribaculum sp.]|nr:DUF4923 family protein [Paramuribaculum sp.]
MKKILLLLVLALGCSASLSAQSFDLKGMLGNLVSSDKITVQSMTGTWKYSAPAVTFKSSNLLKKAGGAAASSAIESKLSPYYSKAGLNKVVLTVGEDSTFTMTMNKATLKGTISAVTDSKSEANFVFNFKVGGKLPIGKMNAYVTKVGSNNLSITFDVSKLVSIVEKAGSITGSSTISGITKVLQGYDGVCAGFKLSKSK